MFLLRIFFICWPDQSNTRKWDDSEWWAVDGNVATPLALFSVSLCLSPFLSLFMNESRACRGSESINTAFRQLKFVFARLRQLLFLTAAYGSRPIIYFPLLNLKRVQSRLFSRRQFLVSPRSPAFVLHFLPKWISSREISQILFRLSLKGELKMRSSQECPQVFHRLFNDWREDIKDGLARLIIVSTPFFFFFTSSS